MTVADEGVVTQLITPSDKRNDESVAGADFGFDKPAGLVGFWLDYPMLGPSSSKKLMEPEHPGDVLSVHA